LEAEGLIIPVIRMEKVVVDCLGINTTT